MLLFCPTVQRRRRLHGHPRLRRVLWFGHLLGPLSTKSTPKQTPEWIRLSLWCVCNDWWATNGFYRTPQLWLDSLIILRTLIFVQHLTLIQLCSYRNTVSVDVLAQFQLSHHRPWWRTAQSGHQHIPGPGLMRPHHCGHLQHVSEAWQTGHGNFFIYLFFWWERKKQKRSVISVIFSSLVCFTWQVHIQNATLAGGVAMGTAAEFMITPYGSLIVGFLCGIISTFGYLYITVSQQ